ncbi:MAG: prepilin-type N-terminal cleavage/methylation domain-containing protein [bacterium]|nr:prepilin-type N-terminal cleavage/methylation domain-containing protein [bacterium]
MNKKHSKNSGFTLLEILLVVAAIGILTSIVIVAINPNKQLGVTRNAERQTDVNTILNAVYQYSIDNNGFIPSTITASTTEICAVGGVCTGLIDLTVLSTNQVYLISLPVEPQKTNVNGIGYMVSKTANGRITVEAQFEEQSAVISATR